jgi:protein TonB
MAVHALAIGLLLWPRKPAPVQLEEVPPPGPAVLRFPRPGPAAAAGDGHPIARPPVQKDHHPKPPRLTLAQAAPAAAPVEQLEPEPDDVTPSDGPASTEPNPVGQGSGGGGGGDPNGVPGGIDDGSGPAVPLAFQAQSMTPPQRLAGPDPSYTPQALEHEVEGVMLVRCIVGLDGTVRDCRVAKSLPFMDREVIQALERRRYLPATLGGRPVAVDYTFKIELRLP